MHNVEAHQFLKFGGDVLALLAAASRCFLFKTNSCSLCFTSDDATAPAHKKYIVNPWAIVFVFKSLQTKWHQIF